MSIVLETLTGGTVVLAQYQPVLNVAEDVWRALHGSADALVRIHDFSRVTLNRIERRQALFLLHTSDGNQHPDDLLHTVIVAEADQLCALTDEMARFVGNVSLLPVFAETADAVMYAAMVVAKYEASHSA